MEDIHEPLEAYRDELKEAFEKNAEEAFEQLSSQSEVDAEANRATCKKIYKTSHLTDIHSTKLLWMKVLMWSVIAVGAILLFFPLYQDSLFPSLSKIDSTSLYLIAGSCIVAGIVLIFVSLVFVQRKIEDMKEELGKLNAELKSLMEEARLQMAPLNNLFSWDIPVKLIEKTVPSIHFDPFFNAARLTELQNEFGYNGFLNEDSSVIFAHSGDVKGNPFVIATVKKFYMGTEIYTGYKTIYWTEYEEDDDGHTERVEYSETLSASVEKPCPKYETKTFLLYANEAAPNLNFSREPEGLAENTAFTGFKKWRKRRKLERFSRDLKDESNYTMMANKEFEVMFNSSDRDNEVEYRLLFTPLAQNAMLKLIKDREVGYGDDFSMVKSKMINVVLPEHLKCFDLNTDPTRFQGWNYDAVKAKFINFNNQYFKEIYFAFAPLLSIPLYQQTRTRKEIYGEKLLNSSSFWEWEALANFEGEDKFADPGSVTDNILKTKLIRERKDGSKDIRVTAHGFYGYECEDSEEVLGGDGNFHTVYIDWIDYDPVSMDTDITIKEMPEVEKDIARSEAYSTDDLRRKILIER